MKTGTTTSEARQGLTCSDLFSISYDEYRAEDGSRLKREYGETPNGTPINGRWVLRGPDGEWIDFDQYRHDIACHYCLNLLENAKGGSQSPDPKA